MERSDSPDPEMYQSGASLDFEDSVFYNSSGPTPCTRKDLEEVMSVGLRPLYAYVESIQTKLDRMVGPTSSRSEMLSPITAVKSLNTLSSENTHPSSEGDGDKTRTSKDSSHRQFSSNNASSTSGDGQKIAAEPWSPTAKPNYGSSFGGRGTSSEDLGEAMQGRISKSKKSGVGVVGEFVDNMMVHHQMANLGASRHKTYNERLLCLVLSFTEWWESIEEPKRSGCTHNIVRSNAFETLCVGAIILNSFFVAYVADWEMSNLTAKSPEVFNYMEYGFVGFYTVELVLRLGVHRLYFFVNSEMRWNIFDFCLVFISLLDLLVLRLLVLNNDPGSEDKGEGSEGGNVVFLRVLRLCKMVKVMRAFRAMRFFKDLAVMLESFRNSFVALFWTFVMLGFILYVFALIFLQGMIDYLKSSGNKDDPTELELVHGQFGSMTTSMLSLYKAVTGGDDWGVYHEVIDKAGPLYSGFFIAFVFFFTFALFNILTGIFVEKAVVASAPDRDDLVLQQRRKARQDSAEFRHMCAVLDEGNTGTITWEDFEKQMRNEVMVSYMASVGLEVREVELFFHIVAGATSGAVSIDRFVEGCMQMKGSATGIDMQRQLFEMHLLHEDVKHFEHQTTKMIKACMKRLDDLSRSKAKESVESLNGVEHPPEPPSAPVLKQVRVTGDPSLSL